MVSPNHSRPSRRARRRGRRRQGEVAFEASAKYEDQPKLHSFLLLIFPVIQKSFCIFGILTQPSIHLIHLLVEQKFGDFILDDLFFCVKEAMAMTSI